MPVTFASAKKLAESFDFNDQRLTPADILRDACHAQYEQCNEILQSSFGPSNSQDIIPTSNGFVDTVLKSYNQHRALIIRPDDVWLAILTQFNFFVNANAEVLRSQFVTHKGRKQLTVKARGNRYTVDFGHMASTMTKEIEKNVVDPALRAWILPDFTTTTTNDTIVCSIIMMATMDKYFSYKMCLACGIPRVTLEGEKADWEKILNRLEKLKEYGLQTIAWYHLLLPVISRFVRAFNAPDAEENLDFWGRVAHYHSGGSGPAWLAGWITAFCVFDEDGKWMGNPFKDVCPFSDLFSYNLRLSIFRSRVCGHPLTLLLFQVPISFKLTSLLLPVPLSDPPPTT
jgi:hypothetical protein